MSNPIQIVSDTPSAVPGLGFDDYVRALADAARGAFPPRLTIGLYGPWGSGKSTLLGALDRELSGDANVLVARFDAWRFERAEHVVIPLLYAVTQASKADPTFSTVAKQVGTFLLSLSRSLKYKGPGIEIDGAAVADAMTAKSMAMLDEAFARPFEELQKIPTILGGRRIVVLVDDLDRCSPDKIVNLLEAINLIMDVEGFIFVLALDYEALVGAVSARYPHAERHEFVEKMIQLPFRVPPLPTDSHTLMRDLIPTWPSFVASHSEEMVLKIGEIAASALRGNPRQIKRLVNYVLLLERIVANRSLAIPDAALLALVALQLAWPDEYHSVQEHVRYGSDDPFSEIRASTKPGLLNFAQRHLDQFTDPELLRLTLQLTSAVETTSERAPVPHTAGYDPNLDAQPIDRDAAERRSVELTLRHANWIPVAFEANDFTVFKNRASPLIRFVTGRTSVSLDLLHHAGRADLGAGKVETLITVSHADFHLIADLVNRPHAGHEDYRMWSRSIQNNRPRSQFLR